MSGASRAFDDLVAEAAAAPVDGWDFAWLDGRGTEQRPSWGYQRLLSRRLSAASAAVDLNTGGGEVFAGALAGAADIGTAPATVAATESWPPNALRATRLLHPRGVVVVAVPDQPPLPFTAEAFDLVCSRHPITVWWDEVARVLRPGGSYLGQHIGPATMIELTEFLLGPMPGKGAEYAPDLQRAAAEAAGFQVTDVRLERLRAEFFDIGAVIYFLRKVIWTVPDFSVERFRDRLRDLHDQIEADGRFVAHSTRVLIEARKPA